MHALVGIIGALMMVVTATLFWDPKAKRIAMLIVFVIGAGAMAWANWQWMIILLVFSALCFLVAGLKAAKRSSDAKALQKRRSELEIPTDAVMLTYNGGDPQLPAGKVFGYVNGGIVKFVEMKSGKRAAILKASIRSVDLHSDVQTVVSGGGRSVGGAVVGEMVAGPVGAIVGSRKRTKKETIDRSTVHMRVANDSGMETSLIFKGGQPTYNQLTKLVGTK